MREYIFEIAILLLGGDRHDALMRGRLRQTRQLVARHGADRHARRPAELRNLLDLRVSATRGKRYVVKPASASGERFLNRMDSEDNLHEI